MSFRADMERAEQDALETRCARREYERATPLQAYATRGKVHLGRPGFKRAQYVVLACSGRSMTGCLPTDAAVSCKRCRALQELSAGDASAEPTETPAPRGAMPPALPAQLDMDGRAHELAPEHERLRLFVPAPTQLPGQTYMAELGELAPDPTNHGRKPA